MDHSPSRLLRALVTSVSSALFALVTLFSCWAPACVLSCDAGTAVSSLLLLSLVFRFVFVCLELKKKKKN